MDGQAGPSRPFLNSSGWWWLFSSIFLISISCHKTHANSYYGAWPGWAVSVNVLPLTIVSHICHAYRFFKTSSGDTNSKEYAWNAGDLG